MPDNQTGEYDKIQHAIGLIQSRDARRPAVGIVLGSGLGAFADQLTERTTFPYADIPHMPNSAVVGHAGELHIGYVDHACVAVLAGRVHLYEGWSPAESVFGVRILAALGVHTVLLTNAAGGINPGFAPGDLMLIRDHLNLTGQNPLIGRNEDRFGPRFPDMSDVYSRITIDYIARMACRIDDESPGERPTVHKGVYAQLIGPSYETPAEIRMLERLGADAVGMSTVLEAIALRHCGVHVDGISCITNMAAGIVQGQKLSHDEVMETGRRASDFFVKLLTFVVPNLTERIK